MHFRGLNAHVQKFMIYPDIEFFLTESFALFNWVECQRISVADK